MFRCGAVIGLLLALLGAMGGRPAEARETVIDDTYTIDLPQDWGAVQIEPGYTLFYSQDRNVVFLVTVGQSMPRHREITAPMARSFDHLRQGSPDRFASLMRIKPKRVAVTVIGDHPDRVRVYRSIKALPGNKLMQEWGGGGN